jgi:hypothetical protein
MKTLRNILSILISGFYGLITIAGLGFLGFLFYDGIKGFLGILLFVIFILLGLFLGYVVFITARRRGFVEFATAINASPDLDNLEPTSDSYFRKLNTQEYFEKLTNGDKLFSGGYIRIWGDFRSRQLDIFNEINRVRLDMSDVLVIEFTNDNKVTIVNPNTIFESTSYLKILEATEIIWEWIDKDSKERFYFNYLVNKRSIKTKTNSDWKSYKIDTILGQPAIFIFNNE